MANLLNSLVDKFDPRGSTFQIYYSVTRTNTRDGKPVILTMDGAQKYQMMLADYLDASYYNLIPNMLGLVLDNDPFYAQERPNIEFVGDILNIPRAIDVAIIHERYTQMSVARNIGDNLGFPIIYVEHFLPKPSYQIDNMKKELGDAAVVFRTEEARDAWGYAENEAFIINDGIVTCNRKYSPTSSKWYTVHKHIDLEPATLWKEMRGEKLPIEVHGFNASAYAYETTESQESSLLDRYTGYFNVRKDDPLPVDFLRACARGMPVMSIPTPSIEKFFKDGESVMLVRSLDDVRAVMAKSKEELKQIGQGAQSVIKTHFTFQNFQQQWKDILHETIFS